MPSKTVTIHQPEAFPWLGFFHKMMRAELYVFLDNVQFRKNYFQNRNQFLTNNGTTYLSIPVNFPDEKIIKDLKIKNEIPWKKKHLSTFHHMYSKTPFFKEHMGFLQEYYSREIEHLADFNIGIIQYIKDYLGIKTEFMRASNLDAKGSGTELLLNICKETGATTYLSGRDGKNYLEMDLFERANIPVIFHSFTHPQYHQYKREEFVPFMSTLDLLFNHHRDECLKIIDRGS